MIKLYFIIISTVILSLNGMKKKITNTAMLVYLKDVRPWFLHDMGQAEQMKQSFSHKTFPLTVTTQCLTDLGLVGFACYLSTHKR